MVHHFVIRPKNDNVSTTTTTNGYHWYYIVILVPAILLSRNHNNVHSLLLEYLFLNENKTFDTGTDNHNNNKTTTPNKLFLYGSICAIVFLVRCFLFGSRNKTLSFSSSSSTAKNIENKRSSPALILSVFPAGVQLSRTTTTTTLTKLKSSSSLQSAPPPLYFIPRTEIVDCIVQEVIWSYKVTNVLFFRVLTSSKKEAMTTTRQQEQQQTLQLIEVFPGAELLYMECLALRGEIHKALGI